MSRRKHYRKNPNREMNIISGIIIIFLAACSLFPTVKTQFHEKINKTNNEKEIVQDVDSKKGTYESSNKGRYTVENKNSPEFSPYQLKKARKSYKKFSELDKLGRCGKAEASIGPDLLPKEKRESIGMVKPSGWHTVRYDELIKDHYLYNRCHLIAFSLSGENANEKNLITGTRYFNTEGMLPFEMKVLNYVRNTGNHVLYRVTPNFIDDNLVASGVYMEAESVEDNGKGLKFSVYVNNIQPGIEIDYKTGESRIEKH